MGDTTSEWVVIDTETTGLRDGARIVELACIVLGPDLRERQRWVSLINPGVEPGPTSVHGIDARMLVGAPCFGDVASAVEQMLVGRAPVAHNLPFDWEILSREFRLLGCKAPPDHRGTCTASLSATLFGERMSLARLRAYLGLTVHRAHRAEPDADALVEVLRVLHERGGLRPARRGCGPIERSWTLPVTLPDSPRPRIAEGLV